VNTLVVSHLYPSPGIGRHLFVHEQVLALQDLGVHARVISPTPYTPRVLWGSSRLRRRGQKPRSATIDGISVDYPRYLQPPRRIFFDRLGDVAYRSAKRLPWLAEESFDVIHAHQALPDGALAQLLARRLGVPYVVTLHGTDVHVGLERGGVTAQRIAAVLRDATAVTVVSHALAGKLAHHVALANVHIVHNGFTAAATPGATPAARERLVVAAGRLVSGKGLEQVIEALALLGAPDVRCVIAGDGPLRRSLEALAARLGVSERVRLVGQLPREELLALMASAQVFALPSSPEGFGLVHLEAMAQGTPVIACRDEGPSDFIDDGVSGYLVASGDGRAVADALHGIFADPAGAAVVGEAGRRVAMTFTWERNAQEMLRIYEGAVAAGTTAARRAEA
jgi:teichuronic acid biosynthesis glycosyltransferase TuaC